jgi:Fe-S cluster assembly iron-binding protein IscA
VLTLTDSAVAAIRDLLVDKDVTAEGGLRISTGPPANGDNQPSFELAVVTGPEATDAVVEHEGVYVYLEPAALSAFEDKILDAHLGEAGISFTFLPSG